MQIMELLGASTDWRTILQEEWLSTLVTIPNIRIVKRFVLRESESRRTAAKREAGNLGDGLVYCVANDLVR